MMRNFVVASLALFGTAAFACLPANATNFSHLSKLNRGLSLNGAIVKVHTRRKVHDMLHGYGFDRVVYRSQYYDEDNKPVYRFKVCMGRRAYMVDVNWYGHIIDEHRAGRCHRYYW